MKRSRSLDVRGSKKMRDGTLANVNILDDLLRRIIFDYIPLHEWAKLEKVSQQFRRVTLSTYLLLRTVNVGDFYPECSQKKSERQTGVASRKLESILLKLTTRSPKLKELVGFSDVSIRVLKKHFTLLEQLAELTSVAFANCEFNLAFLCDFLGGAKNLRDLSLSNSVFIIGKNTLVPTTPYLLLASTSFPVKSYHQRVFINAEYLWEKIANINGLNSLYLDGLTAFTGRFLLSVNANNITSFTLSKTKLYSEYVCQFLEKCTSLESLSLWMMTPCAQNNVNVHSVGGIINRYIFECLPGLKKLRKLSIMGYGNFYATDRDDFQRVVENALSECTGLHELSLINKFVVTDSLMQKISFCCPDLRILQVDMDDLKQCDIFSCLLNLKELRALTLFSCRLLASVVAHEDYTCDQTRENIISLLPHQLRCLERIAINRPVKSVTSLQRVLRFKNLKEVLINGYNIDDNFVEQLCLNVCNQLTILELPRANISDRSANFIAMCEKLKILNLRYSKMTDEGVRKIAAKCKSLRKADFFQYDNIGISVEGLTDFVVCCQRLIWVFINPKLIESIETVIGERHLNSRAKFYEHHAHLPYISSIILH